MSCMAVAAWPYTLTACTKRKAKHDMFGESHVGRAESYYYVRTACEVGLRMGSDSIGVVHKRTILTSGCVRNVENRLKILIFIVCGNIKGGR